MQLTEMYGEGKVTLKIKETIFKPFKPMQKHAKPQNFHAPSRLPSSILE